MVMDPCTAMQLVIYFLIRLRLVAALRMVGQLLLIIQQILQIITVKLQALTLTWPGDMLMNVWIQLSGILWAKFGPPPLR